MPAEDRVSAPRQRAAVFAWRRIAPAQVRKVLTLLRAARTLPLPMSPPNRVGALLAAMRETVGLSAAEWALRAGVDGAAVLHAEAGGAEPSVVARLLRALGLDEDALRDEDVVAVDADHQGSAFLLHGAMQDFRAADLNVFARSLAYGRRWARRAPAETWKNRLRWGPIRPAGPRAAQAARQGYHLARQVRASLGLGGEPLPPLVQLFEQRLGVVVLCERLSTRQLNAAAILAPARAAGAIILAPSARTRPDLARVWMAHELCHLLFDHEQPQTVQIALDDQPEGRSTSLRESRAKGFAAEFLMPLEGLRGLLGVPSSPTWSLPEAVTMLMRARIHFGTPWMLTAYHLINLGLVEGMLLPELEGAAQGPVPCLDDALPAVAAVPRCLEDEAPLVPWTRAEAPPEVAEVGARAAETEAAQGIAAHAPVLEETYALCANGCLVRAADVLGDALDALFLASQFERAGVLLDRIDPDRIDPEALTPILSVARSGRLRLEGAYERFAQRVFASLREHWKVEAATLARIEARLA